MADIRFLNARNTVSGDRQRLEQELVFFVRVAHIAYDKRVEVHWAGEDRVWRTLCAEYLGPCGAGHEIWRARATFHASGGAKLPGDIQFALRYQALGRECWDNNRSRNYFLGAGSGVLLHKSARLANIDFEPFLRHGQHIYPIAVAVRHSLQPKRVWLHWTTDDWRSTRITPCYFRRTRWDRMLRGGARNPSRYDTSVWISQLNIDDAYRLQYAIACETPSGTIWDNNFGQNFLARRDRLKVLTLNLHCYQEENQDAKFAQIAHAIEELDIDLVCLQEVGENWNEGRGDWSTNAARIIRDRLHRHYHLHTDWSHLGFDRYREGLAVLSKYGFRMTDSGYVSAGQDPYSIDSRKVVMVQVDVPYMGLVNVFSAHLSWLSGGFLDQFERLRAWANHKHGGHLAATFLCGDFNIEAGSEGYQAVVRTGQYEDQFLAVTAPKLFDKVFRTDAPDIGRALASDGRIDYIFMQKRGNLRAVAARELFTEGDRYGRVSDHTGYCVEFEPDW
jgi:maltose 6'-phosphate phosphatase